MTQKLALVFPGQGSQTIGMLHDFIALDAEIAADVCAEASTALGYDIAKVIAQDATRLDQTEVTQPALLVAGVIAWRIWCTRNDVMPAFLAGHSLGEYTALVCAGALSLSAAVQLVAKRGALMQQAVAPGVGAMAAILGLDLATVENICVDVANTVGIVQVANINAPGQIVIAGVTAAVTAATEEAKAQGAKRAITLPVSVPSHCTLMRTAATEFMQDLMAIEWQAPRIPVVHNVDVKTHIGSDEICLALQQQLFNQVRWVETVEYFAQQGVTEIIECGPGKVLTGLNKRIAPQLLVQDYTQSISSADLKV